AVVPDSSLRLQWPTPTAKKESNTVIGRWLVKVRMPTDSRPPKQWSLDEHHRVVSKSGFGKFAGIGTDKRASEEVEFNCWFSLPDCSSSVAVCANARHFHEGNRDQHSSEE